jgi:hypothetical protein
LPSCKLFPLQVIYAKGHKNIAATHRTTFEITKEGFLTKRGDCIIGISSSASAEDLNEELRKHVQGKGELAILLVSGKQTDIVFCHGDHRLSLQNPYKLIVRKSTYADDSTLCVEASKAAAEIDRGLIKSLSEGGELLVVIFAIS